MPCAIPLLLGLLMTRLTLPAFAVNVVVLNASAPLGEADRASREPPPLDPAEADALGEAWVDGAGAGFDDDDDPEPPPQAARPTAVSRPAAGSRRRRGVRAAGMRGPFVGRVSRPAALRPAGSTRGTLRAPGG